MVRRILISAMVLVALLLAGGAGFMALPVLGQNDEAQERSRFLAFVEEKISGPGRQIRINGIEGALSSNASIAEITISDDEGVWLRITNATIIWTRTALFRGRLDIEELSAERIDFPRLPVPSGTAPAPEAGGLVLPDLPVAVLLDNFAIAVLRLGEPVFGLEAELTTTGMVRLEDGSLETDVSIERIDGPGGNLTLTANYDQDTAEIDLDLALQEPANGVVANLLNIDDRPPVDLTLVGQGPVDALDLELALDAADQRILTGITRMRGVGDGLGFSADLDGPISELISPAYRGFFGETTHLSASGVFRDGGGMRLDRFDLNSGALSLTAEAATASDGFLTSLIADARLQDGGGDSILLPVPGQRTTIRGGALRVDFGGATAPVWSANFQLDEVSTDTLTVQTIAFDLFGRADALDDPARRMVGIEGEGRATGITAPDPRMAEAIGERIDITLRGLWEAGEPFRLDEASVVGNGIGLAAAGTVRESTFSGDVRAEAADLLPFSALAGRDLSGALALLITGQMDFTQGSFDLALDGETDALRLGVKQLDDLLSGRTHLSGGLVRDANGLAARQVQLQNDQMRAAVDGSFASDAADIRLEAVLNTLATLNPQADGRALLTASAVGRDGPIELDAGLSVETGRLQNLPLSNASLSFTGTLLGTTVDGDIEGGGLLGQAPFQLNAGLLADHQVRILNDVVLTTTGANVSGSVRQQVSDGLMTGNLALDASDIQTIGVLLLTRARGAVTAEIELSHSSGLQAASIRAVMRELRWEGFEVGTGEVNASINDVFGAPAFQGALTANDIVGADLSIGRLVANATPDQSFTVRARDIYPDALRGLGVAPIAVEAQGRFTALGINLARANISAAQGLQASASGQVPFQGAGLDVRVEGAIPLALANRFVSDRGAQFSGSASVNARVAGRLSNPQISGTVSTQGARLVDPGTGLRLSAINLSARLDGENATIERASASVDGGGTLSMSGRVGLGSGSPADLRLVLDRVRHSDGTLVVATVTGDLTITGALANGPLIAGTVLVNEAEIQVPDSFGSANGMIEVVHIAPSQRVRETFERARSATSGSSSGPSSAARLDILVQAPNQIYVRGRGLNAELGGQVRLNGLVTNIEPVGAFNLIRGRLDILGQRIDLTEGGITLIGDLDPFINLIAETEGDAITVVIAVTGRVSEPTISLSSQPELPEDEILARLIFDRGLNELSPLQIAQLAAAANELAGNSDGSIIGDIRDGLGLDDIDIITDETGGPAVRATQYVQENIYVGVEAGTSGTTRATINLDITEDLTARGAVSSSGQSSIGIFFERDY